jgi:hypothetical protein
MICDIHVGRQEEKSIDLMPTVLGDNDGKLLPIWSVGQQQVQSFVNSHPAHTNMNCRHIFSNASKFPGKCELLICIRIRSEADEY